ncbi:MAG: OsmC family protein [Athalassotoga sp.]|uniref:OsmC family protein n=1 Tax=Athalassotoga sp. TaxID=2022597 RepID=UPI003CFC407C
MPDMKFSVTAKCENPTKLVVNTSKFKIIIDEPPNLGGTDDGPNPVEYVLAALGGCLNVVGHLVAKEMGMELKGLEMTIEGEMDPSKFMGKPTKERTGYKEIRVNLKPVTSADKATIDKWIKAVEDRCPVSDNLRNPTPIKISVLK